VRLIYLADFEIPSRTASSVNVMRMCRAFAKVGCEVILIVPKGREAIEDVYAFYDVSPDFAIRFIRLPRMPGRNFIYGCLCFFYLLRFKPDIVYSRSVWALFLNNFFWRGILELHAPVWKYGRLYAIMFSMMLKRHKLLRVVVISNRLKEIQQSRYPSVKYLVAHDGADSGHTAANCKIESLSGFNVGYAGSIYKGRGIEYILQIAKGLPEIVFHIFGGNKEDLDQGLFKDIPSNVIFHGYMPPFKVSSCLKPMNVLLAPYQANTTTVGGTNSADFMSPLKIFEYMSLKKPIIASDLPALREILDETCAVLVPPSDIIKWQEAIVSMKNSSFASKLGSEAFKRFVDNYTWEKRANRVLSGIVI
jgi:glycosyltransferase involved in cell wall biosynthesis